MTPVQTLFSLDGRLRRRDWWFFSLSLFALETAVNKAVELVLVGPTADLDQGNVFSWLLAAPVNDQMLAVSGVIMIALVWPNLALTVRRAHDRNTRGLWLCGILLLSYAPFFAPPDLMQRSGAALDRGDWVGGLPLAAETILNLANFVSIVILGFLDGTPGPNRYGPSPKGIGGDRAETLAEVFD